MATPQRFGILNVAKPAGITSRRVVDHVARLVRPDKAGHAGTLDPLATGVLVVCVGKATRLIDLVQKQVKSYEAQFLLGRQSDTDDVAGNVTEIPVALEITRSEVESLLPSFVGRIAQAPPKFSAVHIDGRRAYELARRGEEIDLAPREVDVFRLELTRFSYPEFELAIDCGSGTYVRSIGRDIGRALGCGAVLSALVRTRIGPYRLADTVSLDGLTSESIGPLLLPPTTAVEGLPCYYAQADDVPQIRAGRPLHPGGRIEAMNGTLVAILDQGGELLCLAEFDAPGNHLLPRRVFAK